MPIKITYINNFYLFIIRVTTKYYVQQYFVDNSAIFFCHSVIPASVESQSAFTLTNSVWDAVCGGSKSTKKFTVLLAILHPQPVDLRVRRFSLSNVTSP